jgi:hypothetical protein
MAFIIPAAMLATSIYGQIQNASNQEDEKRAQDALRAQQLASAQRLANFAPMDEAAQTNTMNQALSGYTALNNLAGSIGGPGAKVDLNKMGQDPFKGTGYQAGKS